MSYARAMQAAPSGIGLPGFRVLPLPSAATKQSGAKFYQVARCTPGLPTC